MILHMTNSPATFIPRRRWDVENLWFPTYDTYAAPFHTWMDYFGSLVCPTLRSFAATREYITRTNIERLDKSDDGVESIRSCQGGNTESGEVL